MKIELQCSINESLTTHYIVYKMVNTINNKYYIGQHVTNNVFDNYSGSGSYLERAQKKYGLDNFIKIILFDFDNFDDMNNKEKELVPISECYPNNPMSYNLKEGGSNGGHTLDAIEKLKKALKHTWETKSDEERRQHGLKTRNFGEKNGRFGKGYEVAGALNPMYGVHRFGELNPMYGKRGKDSPNFGSKRTKEQRDRMSLAAKNRGPSDIRNQALSRQRKNTKHMYNPTTHEGKFVKFDDIEYYLSLGWVLGKYKG